MAAFDFKTIEEKVLKFWEDHDIFQKSMQQRLVKRAKRFVFFEGPPTANGRPGIHHFIGRAFKDVFNRYKTMRGFYVLRKAGWDTHGLPVEIGVEKALGFKSKKEIEEYGIAPFNRKAKESVWEYKSEWERFTKRIGFWVDLEHPYITYESSYMESVWNVLSTAWDKQLLYQAHKVVPFCTRCGTPLSAHEVAQGYKTDKDTSVYLKFKLTSGDFSGAYVLAWTTTPWTLPGNVALAVGNEIDYVLVRKDNEQMILAAELVEKVLGSNLNIEKTFKGSELVGASYEPLFNVSALQSETSYKIYPASFVSTTDGTGVVHTAVMYGEDDYNLGTAVGLPKIHTVDEQGKFFGVSAELDGRYVKSKGTEDIILNQLLQQGNVLKTELYEHEYPHCWRCDTPLLYYAKSSWFIKMSAVNQQLLANNEKTNWVPDHIKSGRFGQWISEGKDWSISRERYWSTPLPIWKCVKCGHLRMIDSVKSLKKSSLKSGNTYYVMRHGLTTRDEHGKVIIGSRLESDIYVMTPEGKQQVQSSLERLQSLAEHVDVIYSSPFKRTLETAQMAATVFHREVKTDERLSELMHGMVCENKPHQQCVDLGGNNVGFVHKQPDGENWDDVRRRVLLLMQELEATYKNKKILIVSHGDPLWLLDKIAQGKTSEQIKVARNSPEDWYPSLAEFKELDWQSIPRNELGELDLHRPYIDNVVIKCEECRAQARRIPDVSDVWLDSGCMPYAQWHWPFENSKMFKEQFPADFICEGIDQTRGWFYTLLAVSTLMDKGAPFKNVISYSHILDEKGQKMSKSKGNVVDPFDVIEKVGADTARWWFYTASFPGEYKYFSFKELEERLSGFLSTLQNCMRFYELYESQASGEVKIESLLDKWLMSRYNRILIQVTERLDAYDFTTAGRLIERFVIDDFSNWWLRRSRKRTEALSLLRHMLLEIAKMVAPMIPFTAEDMWHRLQGEGESVHLADWSSAQKRAINDKLEEQMTRVQQAITAGLALRKQLQLKVRQPLAGVTLTGKKFDKDLERLVKEELNVKEVNYQKTGDLAFDMEITPELRAEGFAREAIRQIQDMRKEAKYAFDAPAYCQWYSTDTELTSALNHWAETIQKETILSGFLNMKNEETRSFDVDKEFELAPGKKLWLGIKR